MIHPVDRARERVSWIQRCEVTLVVLDARDYFSSSSR
jgi:hypothetical protein